MATLANSGEQWTGEELAAAVDAYLEMLESQTAGRPYSKAEVVQRLLRDGLPGRTKSSAEFRMQNISAVLDDLKLRWVKGYPPAKNVGTRVKDRILEILRDRKQIDEEDYSPTESDVVLAQRVKSLRKRGLISMPLGTEKPAVASATATVYARSAAVKAWVLMEAKGRCEACGTDAPFKGSDGEPYLEVHHLVQLSLGGADTPWNAVALCPNCHRRAHFASDRALFVDRIRLSVKRLR